MYVNFFDIETGLSKFNYGIKMCFEFYRKQVFRIILANYVNVMVL